MGIFCNFAIDFFNEQTYLFLWITKTPARSLLI